MSKKQEHSLSDTFDWAGSRILFHTVIPSKRRVIGNEDILIPTDLREWITPVDSQEIRQVIDNLELPHSKTSGDFDKRAMALWQYVAANITYRPDEIGQRKPDFWQFPAETLAMGKGDCEDCAFLLASLLLASGISPFCVRVVFGVVTDEKGKSSGHTWPTYKDEKGIWRILESTLDQLPRKWHRADEMAHENARPRYFPDICLNHHHVWIVGKKRRIQNVASYLKNVRRNISRLSRKRVCSG